jgi:flagellin-like protein
MSRAISPVIGTLLLAAITVALAAVLATTVGTAALAGPMGGGGGEDLTQFTRLSAAASPDGEVVLTNEAGDPLDVADLTVRVTVDGDPLAEQPPVPFFSTAGFEPGPTGPFNSGADSRWSVGEVASFTISDSNAPVPEAGDRVTVEVIRDGRPVAQVRTTVSNGGG